VATGGGGVGVPSCLSVCGGQPPLLGDRDEARPRLRCGAVSRYLTCPTKECWVAIGHIFRYLEVPPILLWCWGEGSDSKHSGAVRGYSDADWGANDSARRSISGYVFFYGGGAIAGVVSGNKRSLSARPRLSILLSPGQRRKPSGFSG